MERGGHRIYCAWRAVPDQALPVLKHRCRPPSHIVEQSFHPWRRGDVRQRCTVLCCAHCCVLCWCMCCAGAIAGAWGCCALQCCAMPVCAVLARAVLVRAVLVLAVPSCAGALRAVLCCAGICSAAAPVLCCAGVLRAGLRCAGVFCAGLCCDVLARAVLVCDLLARAALVRAVQVGVLRCVLRSRVCCAGALAAGRRAPRWCACAVPVRAAPAQHSSYQHQHAL